MAKTKSYNMRLVELAQYLESVGINPNETLIDGVTDVGYWELTGHRKIWRTWPSPEVGPKVLDILYPGQG